MIHITVKDESKKSKLVQDGWKHENSDFLSRMSQHFP
jgi:hypothetical protein